MADNVITIFEAQTEDYQKKINELISSVGKLGDKEQAELAKTQLGIRKKIDSIKEEQAAVKELEKRLKQATTAEGQKHFQNEIDKSKLKIQQLSSEVKVAGKDITNTFNKAEAGAKKTGSVFSSLSPQLKNIIGLMGLAFSATAIKSFGAAALDAFSAQEKAEKKLLTALKGRGDIQQRLIKQAQELQEKTLFGDDETIKAQSLVAAFVKQEDQIKKLIPLIQDFATAKEMDLATAADLVTKSFASNTNALTRYGVELKGQAGSQERFETLTKNLNAAFGGQAQAVAKGSGVLQQYKNIASDVMESIGGIIFRTIQPFIKTLTEGAITFNSFLGSLTRGSDKLREVQGEFNAEFEVLKNGNLTFDQRKNLLEEINKKYKEYLPNLLTEKSSLQEIDAAQRLGNEAIRQKIVLLATQEILQEKVNRAAKLQKEGLELQIELEERRARQEILNANRTNDAAQNRAAINQQEISKLENAVKKNASFTKLAIADLTRFEVANAQILQQAIKPSDANTILVDETEKAKTAIELLKERIEKLKTELENQAVAGKISTQTLLEYQAAVRQLESALNLLTVATQKFEEAQPKTLQVAIDNLKEIQKLEKERLDEIDKRGKPETRSVDTSKEDIEEFRRLEEKIKLTGKLTQEEKARFEQIKTELGLLTDADIQKIEFEIFIKGLEDAFAVINELGSAFMNLQNVLFDNEVQRLEASKQQLSEHYSFEQNELQKKLDNGLISEGLANKQREQLEAARVAKEQALQKKINAEKLKQWKANQAASLGQAIINGFLAASKTLGETGIFGIPLLPLVIAANALNVIGIASAKPPQFFEGTAYVERGKNKKGRDTIPAMLHEGERVTPTAQNLKYWNTYNELEKPQSKYRSIFDAIEKGRLEDYVLNLQVAPVLRKAKVRKEKEVREEKMKLLSQSITVASNAKGFDQYEARRIMQDEGISIRKKDLKFLLEQRERNDFFDKNFYSR